MKETELSQRRQAMTFPLRASSSESRIGLKDVTRSPSEWKFYRMTTRNKVRTMMRLVIEWGNQRGKERESWMRRSTGRVDLLIE